MSAGGTEAGAQATCAERLLGSHCLFVNTREKRTERRGPGEAGPGSRGRACVPAAGLAMEPRFSKRGQLYPPGDSWKGPTVIGVCRKGHRRPGVHQAQSTGTVTVALHPALAVTDPKAPLQTQSCDHRFIQSTQVLSGHRDFQTCSPMSLYKFQSCYVRTEAFQRGGHLFPGDRFTCLPRSSLFFPARLTQPGIRVEGVRGDRIHVSVVKRLQRGSLTRVSTHTHTLLFTLW